MSVRREVQIVAITMYFALGACAEEASPQPQGSAPPPVAAAEGGGGRTSDEPQVADSGARLNTGAAKASGSSVPRDAGTGTANPVSSDDGGEVTGEANPPEGVDAVLCDGAPGLTFAAVQYGGGAPLPSTLISAENGHAFILVEGTCRYWSFKGRLDHVVTGTLQPADLAVLREDFRLERWQEFVGNYGQSGFDMPGYFFFFGREKIKEPCGASGAAGGCIHIGNGSGTGKDVNWAPQGLLRNVGYFQERGEIAKGDIRYQLVAGEATIHGAQWDSPSSWPLGDPSAVAISQEEADQGYVAGTTDRATGADADALREVWRKFLDYEISGRYPDMPPGASLAIPVEVEGTRYQLFIRDSIPLEDDKGQIDYGNVQLLPTF